MTRIARHFVLVSAVTLLPMASQADSGTPIRLTPAEARQRVSALRADLERELAEAQGQQLTFLESFPAQAGDSADSRRRFAGGVTGIPVVPLQARPAAAAKAATSTACGLRPVLGICPCFTQEQATAWAEAQLAFRADPTCLYQWDNSFRYQNTYGGPWSSFPFDREEAYLEGYCYQSSGSGSWYAPGSGLVYAFEFKRTDPASTLRFAYCIANDYTTGIWSQVPLQPDEFADCVAMVTNALYASGRF